MLLLHQPDKIEAVAVWQAHVGQAQVESFRGQQAPGARQVSGGPHAQLHAAQSHRDQIEQIRFVIND